MPRGSLLDAADCVAKMLAEYIGRPDCADLMLPFNIARI
jgi:hypothetical protein